MLSPGSASFRPDMRAVLHVRTECLAICAHPASLAVTHTFIVIVALFSRCRRPDSVSANLKCAYTFTHAPARTNILILSAYTLFCFWQPPLSHLSSSVLASSARSPHRFETSGISSSQPSSRDNLPLSPLLIAGHPSINPSPRPSLYLSGPHPAFLSSFHFSILQCSIISLSIQHLSTNTEPVHTCCALCKTQANPS